MPGFGLHDVEADSVSRGGQPVPPEALILTPSRLRVRSSVVAGYAASQLLNAIFVLLLLFKARLMEVQVGSPPPASASTGMHLQYELVLRIRLRTHMCDNVTALVEALAHVAVKVLFGVLLSRDKLDTVAMRVILIPAWCAWATSVLLNCNKDASERSLISLRDVAYIFWLMVAWKVDGMAGYEWRLVFVIPWFWFAVVFLFGAVLVITLILAKAWARVQQLLLPMGFAAFLSAH
ncbi:RING-type domain-containing protein, partial [Haematococcus lacustris]